MNKKLYLATFGQPLIGNIRNSVDFPLICLDAEVIKIYDANNLEVYVILENTEWMPKNKGDYEKLQSMIMESFGKSDHVLVAVHFRHKEEILEGIFKEREIEVVYQHLRENEIIDITQIYMPVMFLVENGAECHEILPLLANKDEIIQNRIVYEKN